jgi:hypothetical protein
LHVLLAWFLIACFDPMVSWLHFLINMVLWQLFLWSSRWLRVFCVFGAYKVRTFAGVACFFWSGTHFWSVSDGLISKSLSQNG